MELQGRGGRTGNPVQPAHILRVIIGPQVFLLSLQMRASVTVHPQAVRVLLQASTTLVASLFRRKNLLLSISSSSINLGHLFLGLLTLPNFGHTWAPSFVMSGQNQSMHTSAAAVSNIFATGSVVDLLA